MRLATVGDPIEAKIIAARLGSEGVLWELRGGSGPYPMGPVHVYVDEDDLEVAADVMAIDEAIADEHDRAGERDRAPVGLWLVLATIVALALFGIGRVAFGAGVSPERPPPVPASSP